MLALRGLFAAMLAFRRFTMMGSRGRGHGGSATNAQRRQEHANGEQDREERAKAHGGRMTRQEIIRNAPPTNGQVDETGGSPGKAI